MDTYKKLCAEFYDLSKTHAPPDALEFHLSCLESAAEPVLEPMCGSGRFLIPFLERGIDIDGVDASQYMLQACHNRCQRKGLKPILYQQLLQELDLPREYGYIFIPAGSFGLITDSMDAVESLRRLYRHLLPGGKLLLEIETPRAKPEPLNKWHESRVTRPDGAEIVFNALPMYDPKEQLQRDVHRYELFMNGHLIESDVEDLSLRLYEPVQFRRLLVATGLTDIRVTRPYDDAAPTGEESAVIFRCRKP